MAAATKLPKIYETIAILMKGEVPPQLNPATSRKLIDLIDRLTAFINENRGSFLQHCSWLPEACPRTGAPKNDWLASRRRRVDSPQETAELNSLKAFNDVTEIDSWIQDQPAYNPAGILMMDQMEAPCADEPHTVAHHSLPSLQAEWVPKIEAFDDLNSLEKLKEECRGIELTTTASDVHSLISDCCPNIIGPTIFDDDQDDLFNQMMDRFGCESKESLMRLPHY